MPRADYKNYGKPRNHYVTDAPPQPESKTLKARRSVFDAQKDQSGERRPGSQNPRKGK